MNMRYACAVM